MNTSLDNLFNIILGIFIGLVLCTLAYYFAKF